jgi:hypothetical protein
VYLNQSPIPVEVTPEMVDFYNRQMRSPVVTGPQPYLVSVPGTDIKADINPATSEIINIVGLIGLALLTFYIATEVDK